MHPRFRSSLSVGVELRGPSEPQVLRVVPGICLAARGEKQVFCLGTIIMGIVVISVYFLFLLIAMLEAVRFSLRGGSRVAESVPAGSVSAADVAVHRVRLLLHRVHRAGDQSVLLSSAIGWRLGEP